VNRDREENGLGSRNGAVTVPGVRGQRILLDLNICNRTGGEFHYGDGR